MYLDELNINESAKIISVELKDNLFQHFLDMGLITGTEVTLTKVAPLGDPLQISLHGYELTIRKDDAKKVKISAPYIKTEEESVSFEMEIPSHPGIGEGGKFHNHQNENPLDKNITLTFALAGNQNSGKTTLFNQLTGSNQHVGNFPGVTVDQKSGKIRNKENTLITDLPGIYSLSPYSDEEIVSRDFILNNDIKGIINIVDATNLERNLYLSLQLMELDIPVTIALNMMDEVTGNGGYINVNKMEEILGVPIIPISAKKNQGVEELINHAIHIAYYQEKPLVNDFCNEDGPQGAVHRAIHGIMYLIEDHAKKAHIPVRFASTKIIEGDQLVIDRLCLDTNELEMIEHIVKQMEEERGLTRKEAIADMRYSYIKNIAKTCLKKPKISKERLRSEKIDKILTGKYTALPSFILILGLIFFLTFNVFGALLQNLFEFLIETLSNNLSNALISLNVHPILNSLLIDGIINGIGSVISFLPIIVVLFLFLSLLEDSGYMARIAFLMDKILRKIGLSGKSIVPMLIGFGCTVPGVMATRTLSSDRDRKMTILLTPFMSCSAKLPIYSLLCALFFPRISWLIMVLLYIIGILVAILFAFISKKFIFKGEAIPFVMELPNYRMPGLKNVGNLLWDKVKDFIKRAFSVILIATIVIWFLQNFSFSLQFVDDSSKSMLSIIAGGISVIFKPLGFGDYRFITALISGFMAKEGVVSTLEILFGSELALRNAISPYAAFSLLIFCLLYTPCIASLAAIKRELGKRWMISVAALQLVIAYVFAGIFSLIFFLMGML